MAVNLIPLHDRVIVKRIEEKESVRGGIIIPDSAKEKPMEGEIIAVGAGKPREGRTDPAGRQARRSRPLRQVQRYGKSNSRTRNFSSFAKKKFLRKLSGAAKAAKR